MSAPADRYLTVDEEGHFVFDGRRVDDAQLGRELLRNLRVEKETALLTSLNGQDAFVEAFDAPLVARGVRTVGEGVGELDLPYGHTARFPFSSLCVDEWDRFHGLSADGVPFVLSRQAQVEFFDLLDSFDDDSVSIGGQRYPIPPWLQENGEGNNSDFWSGKYLTDQAGWEKGHESPVLPVVLPQLKLSPSRVLVLGAGSGHDAAHFARAGHKVTAVDFSAEAIARARRNFEGLADLTLEQRDIFELPESWTGRFDLVFEHTCYCAITPSRRNELAAVWRRVLQARGHLLGVFFAMEKRVGPPFGGSEWEVRQRLRPHFDFLYWTRWHHSIEGRRGREFVVYASKRAPL